MKVFISHSSKDKWIARKISDEIEAAGATTFLDEKDIRTGESIDSSIQSHLKGSDEVLMLLSPEALGSTWVLMEVGGAKALGLRLIPILLHVGVNELPPPLADGLARDLNEIDSYYSELTDRIAKQKKGQAGPGRRKKADSEALDGTVTGFAPPDLQFEIGDSVIILDEPERRAARPDISWQPAMDKYAGKAAKIEVIETSRRFVRLDVDGQAWGWAFEWLAPASA